MLAIEKGFADGQRGKMRMKRRSSRRLCQPVFLNPKLRRKRKVWRGLFCLILIGLAGVQSIHWANRFIYQRQRSATTSLLHDLNIADLGDSIVIIAPHPDDEAIGCGGLIQSLVQRGIIPHIVIVTDGENFGAAIRLTFRELRIKERDRRAFSLMRRKETLQAMELLGVPESHVHFLGFLERTIPKDWLVHCDQRPLKAIVQLLTKLQPTTVFIPSRFDDHPVHAIVCSLSWAAILQAHADGGLKELPSIWEFLIHYGEFPIPQGLHPELELLPPSSLLSQGRWFRLNLPNAFRQLKAKAVMSYKTQLPLMGRFLKSFVRVNEIFAQPVPMHRQNDRAGEPRSILPSTDIVRMEIRDKFEPTKTSSSPLTLHSSLTVSLRGKPSHRFSYGVHTFSPLPHSPQINVFTLQSNKQSERRTMTTEISLPAQHTSPYTIVTAFTARGDYFLDIAPFTLPMQEGVVYAP